MPRPLFICGLLLAMFSADAVSQNRELTGPVTEQQIREGYRIFDVYTHRYDPDPASIEYLSSLTDSVRIVVLFGIWCHDSKREIPALFKTLESAQNSFIEAEYIAVTKEKEAPGNEHMHWELEFTPTIIVLQDGQESGRIVEEPTLSIEQDLVNILRSARDRQN